MPTPADLLDLRAWKLTLPIGSKGSPTEVKQPALATYSNPLWFRATSDAGVAFAAPVNGVTTSGSGYPRSELREMNADGSNASWSSSDGKTHTMIIDQAATHLPNPRTDGGNAAVVAGQVHDGSNDISVFRVELGKVWVTKGNDTHYALADGNYVLGVRFQAAFVVAAGKVSAYYNGKLVTSFSAKFSGAYFKSGAYVQANVSNSKPGDATNYGETIVHGLAVVHGAAVPVTPPPPVDPPPVPPVDPPPVPSGTTKIMVIRHGEKPPIGGSKGYTAPSGGTEDSHSLTMQGWARAAGLVGLFNSASGVSKAGLAKPTVIYAADGPNAGERMRETISILAAVLGLKPILAYDKGKESNLAKALKALPAGSKALVSWEHSMIPKISKGLGKVSPKPPSAYPSDRFDVAWVYDLQPDGSWRFSQVLESVLPSDKGYVVSKTAGFVAKVKQSLGIGV